MTNVDYVPKQKNTLRERIHRGFITNEIRDYLKVELKHFDKYNPNSWNKRFTQDMISYRDRLSKSQIIQVERILGNPICIEEHPNGISFSAGY